MNRRIKDKALSATVNLPAAGANVDTGSIELTESVYHDGCEFGILLPEAPLVNGKKITLRIKESKTKDGEYTAVSVLNTQSVTGTATGITRQIVYFPVPKNISPWVKANIAVGADGGDLTDLEAEFFLILP